MKKVGGGKAAEGRLLPSLEILDLSDNLLPDLSAVGALTRRALPQMAELRLQGNPVCDSGGGALALTEALAAAFGERLLLDEWEVGALRQELTVSQIQQRARPGTPLAPGGASAPGGWPAPKRAPSSAACSGRPLTASSRPSSAMSRPGTPGDAAGSGTIPLVLPPRSRHGVAAPMRTVEEVEAKAAALRRSIASTRASVAAADGAAMVAEGGERVSLPRAGRLEQEDALLLDAEYGDEEAATAALVEQLASQSHTVPTQDASATADRCDRSRSGAAASLGEMAVPSARQRGNEPRGRPASGRTRVAALGSASVGEAATPGVEATRGTGTRSPPEPESGSPRPLSSGASADGNDCEPSCATQAEGGEARLRPPPDLEAELARHHQVMEHRMRPVLQAAKGRAGTHRVRLEDARTFSLKSTQNADTAGAVGPRTTTPRTLALKVIAPDSASEADPPPDDPDGFTYQLPGSSSSLARERPTDPASEPQSALDGATGQDNEIVFVDEGVERNPAVSASPSASPRHTPRQARSTLTTPACALPLAISAPWHNLPLPFPPTAPPAFAH